MKLRSSKNNSVDVYTLPKDDDTSFREMENNLQDEVLDEDHLEN